MTKTRLDLVSGSQVPAGGKCRRSRVEVIPALETFLAYRTLERPPGVPTLERGNEKGANGYAVSPQRSVRTR
jgi:hypothetical protein